MKKRGLRFTEEPSAVTLGVFGTASVKAAPVGQHVAIDQHNRRALIVRAGEHGERLETALIENDPVTSARTVAAASEHPEVVLEATFAWYQASNILSEMGANDHLAHPLGPNWDNRRAENDVKDTDTPLDLLRLKVVNLATFCLQGLSGLPPKKGCSVRDRSAHLAVRVRASFEVLA